MATGAALSRQVVLHTYAVRHRRVSLSTRPPLTDCREPVSGRLSLPDVGTSLAIAPSPWKRFYAPPDSPHRSWTPGGHRRLIRTPAGAAPEAIGRRGCRRLPRAGNHDSRRHDPAAASRRSFGSDISRVEDPVTRDAGRDDPRQRRRCCRPAARPTASSPAPRAGKVKGRARVGVRFTQITPSSDRERYSMPTRSWVAVAPATKKKDALDDWRARGRRRGHRRARRRQEGRRHRGSWRAAAAARRSS